MTMAACSPPLPLPRSSMSAVIICHAKTGGALLPSRTRINSSSPRLLRLAFHSFLMRQPARCSFGAMPGVAHSWADGCGASAQGVKGAAGTCANKDKKNKKKMPLLGGTDSMGVKQNGEESFSFLMCDLSPNVTTLRALMKELLETAKSAGQRSSSNLGSRVITFESNSFLSFFSYSLSLFTLARRVSTAPNLGGELISHMAGGKSLTPLHPSTSLHPPQHPCSSQKLMSSILYQLGLIVQAFHPHQVGCGGMMGPFRSAASQGSSILRPS